MGCACGVWTGWMRPRDRFDQSLLPDRHPEQNRICIVTQQMVILFPEYRKVLNQNFSKNDM